MPTTTEVVLQLSVVGEGKGGAREDGDRCREGGVMSEVRLETNKDRHAAVRKGNTCCYRQGNKTRPSMVVVPLIPEL